MYDYEFWQHCYIAALRSGEGTAGAKQMADISLKLYDERWSGPSQCSNSVVDASENNGLSGQNGLDPENEKPE